MHRIGPTPKEAPVCPADLERARVLADVDAYALRQMRAVVRAVLDKAKLGDKTCAELALKYLYQPMRQQESERIARTPQPVGVNIVKALILMSETALDGKGSCPELTPPEPGRDVPQLPDSTSPSPVALAGPEPNRECQICGSPYFSNQPASRYCYRCKKERSMSRLLASKRKYRDQ